MNERLTLDQKLAIIGQLEVILKTLLQVDDVEIIIDVDTGDENEDLSEEAVA